jgi:hypothetical protein
MLPRGQGACPSAAKIGARPRLQPTLLHFVAHGAGSVALPRFDAKPNRAVVSLQPSRGHVCQPPRDPARSDKESASAPPGEWFAPRDHAASAGATITFGSRGLDAPQSLRRPGGVRCAYCGASDSGEHFATRSGSQGSLSARVELSGGVDEPLDVRRPLVVVAPIQPEYGDPGRAGVCDRRSVLVSRRSGGRTRPYLLGEMLSQESRTGEASRADRTRGIHARVCDDAPG